jgi:hypothetical protein
MQKNQMATYRGCKRRMSGGCGSGTPLPWIEIRTRGDEDGMETPLEKEHAGRGGGAGGNRRRDGMRRLMSSSSGELQKNRERGDEHSVRDFFVQEKTVFCGQLTGTLVSTTKTVKWVPHWVGLPHSDACLEEGSVHCAFN